MSDTCVSIVTGWLRRSVVIAAVGLLAGCAGTTLLVQTNPPGANVSLERLGVQGVSDARLSIPEEAFRERGAALGDTLRLSKPGYRDARHAVTLAKGEENRTRPAVLALERIDSVLRIQSHPAGARGVFDFGGRTPPPNWPESFVTPAEFALTSREAMERGADVKLRSLTIDGYTTTDVKPGSPLPLEPGRTSTLMVNFSPIITTLQVMTDPEGASVEDITPGGFGYLGETPLNRNFTWEDVNIWADRNEVKRRDGSFDAVRLTLRITKRGHEEAYLREVMLPLGQQRSFRRELTPLVLRVSFASDPDGVHVYVNRQVRQEQYDEASGGLKSVQVEVKRHLGTTPFTFNMDPNDPLRHGDKLVFEKSGYRSAEVVYALGVPNYHQVMTPVNIAPR